MALNSHRNANNRAPITEPTPGVLDSEGRIWKFEKILKKYYSVDGMEAKYTNGILMDDVNGNYTYNYGSEKASYPHFWLDIYSHYRYGGNSSYENGLTTTY